MKTLTKEERIIADKSILTDYFRSGFTSKQRLGVEYEKLPVRVKNNKAVEFFFDNGILDFLKEYRNTTKTIPIFENDILLGLISNHGTVTLEPGCQMELSLLPLENISDIERELKIYNNLTNKIAKNFGIKFLAIGCQPISTFRNIKIIPKNRYRFMTEFLKDKGSHPYVMMRETAGIQTSIDYKDETDAVRKLSCALKLSPFLSAFFANSPFRNGKLTGLKSNRAHAWLNTDNKRCGLISKKLFEKNTDFTFEDYAEILLDVPMIFQNNEYVGEKTFRNLFEEKEAKLSDWQTHLSLFFPDVRLKNYIEIRNHDCQNPSLAQAVPALYKGIFYSSGGISAIEELMNDFSYYDFEFVRQNAPRFGIDFSVDNKNIADIVKEVLDIAISGLKEFNLNEEKYLEPAIELIEDKLTPADILIMNFEHGWNKDIKKLVDFVTIN